MMHLRSVASVVLAVAALLAVAVPFAAAENPDHVVQFKNTHECARCDLSRADLGGIQAPDARLAGANLTDASLYGASLRGADLRGTILDRANLEMADLTGATGAALSTARTDKRTTCPDGNPGPCN